MLRHSFNIIITCQSLSMKINFKRKKQNLFVVKGIQINWYQHKQRKKKGTGKVNVPVISCGDGLVGKLVEHFGFIDNEDPEEVNLTRVLCWRGMGNQVS